MIPMMSAVPPDADAVMFRLRSITPSAAPAGCEGAWYSYVITQGTNVITGQRSGTPEEVRTAVDLMVDLLNERSGRQRAKAKSR